MTPAFLSRTWADIDLDAAQANAHTLRRLAHSAGGGASDVMAVVKADAYGHGSVPVARACEQNGVGHFGVASVAEAEELRRAGITGDVYTLSPFLPNEAGALVGADAIPLVSSWEQIAALADAGQSASLPVRCFLTIDTGMGREGALPDEARELWIRAQTLRDVRVTGLATHFSSADEPGEIGPYETQAQTDAFFHFVRSLESALTEASDGRGNRGVWLSVCNSPGALVQALPPVADLPRGVRGYLLRGGLLLYGIAPFAGALDTVPEIRPVLSWKACITLVRTLPEGATVGYGKTHTLSRSSRIATVACGYADGFSRRLGNGGTVLLRGSRVPVVGRVSMDQFQIDVSDVPGTSPVAPGEIVTLIGTDGHETQTVGNMARALHTTPHEPTCLLTRRVVRVYHGGSISQTR